MKESVEVRAIRAAESHWDKIGWKVENVSRLGGDHAGYDLLIQKDAHQLKVEVKGSAKPYSGIPDLHSSELDSNLRLIADILFVAYFPDDLPPRIAIIPRDAIPPDAVQLKTSYCIRSGFKSVKYIKQFLLDIENAILPKT